MPVLIAGEDLVQYEAVCWGTGAAAGTMLKAQGVEGLEFIVTVVKDAAIASGASGEFYKIWEEITNPAWDFDPGKHVFISPTTPGALTKDLPDVSGNLLVIAGIATGAHSLWLYPQLLQIEVA